MFALDRPAPRTVTRIPPGSRAFPRPAPRAVRSRSLLASIDAWTPPARRRTSYVGEPAGRAHLEAAGEANALLPLEVRTETRQHIATFFEPPGAGSPFAGIGPSDLHNRDPRDVPLVTGGATVVGNGSLASATLARGANVAFLQLAPWHFGVAPQNVKRVFRRTSFALSRLLANLGAASATPLLERFGAPPEGVDDGREAKRWLEGHYLDTPEEWDDPYRFFRW